MVDSAKNGSKMSKKGTNRDTTNHNTSDNKTTACGRPLVTLTAHRLGPHCPFGNNTNDGDERIQFSLYRGGCVWLRGASGRGKTSIAMVLATGRSSSSSSSSSVSNAKQHDRQTTRHLRETLQMDIVCDWDPSIPPKHRCGVLFQQTSALLLDELTVAGNLAVALEAAGTCFRGRSKTAATSMNPSAGAGSRNSRSTAEDDRTRAIARLLSKVGLNYERDAGKRPTELSGGMARRAGTAMQLSQNKQVIVLDEPFAGLDPAAAHSVARELAHVRHAYGVALLLIAHEPELARVVLSPPPPPSPSSLLTSSLPSNKSSSNSQTMNDNDNDIIAQIVTLTDPPLLKERTETDSYTKIRHRDLMFGTRWRDRFGAKLLDYVFYSLPLIVLTFAATGSAIAMLTADSLRRMDVTEPVLKIVDTEVRPLIKMLTNEEPSVFVMMGVRFKVKQMLHETVPPAKATLFAVGMSQLMILEIGPLLTALLLCGRVGGSYAGNMATMQSTGQSKLLRTLGIRSWHWTLTPAWAAAWLAGPFLTVLGTTVSLIMAGFIGPTEYYDLGTRSEYWSKVWQTSVFPTLRLRGWSQFHPEIATNPIDKATLTTTIYTPYQADFYKSTFSPYWRDAWIEIVTYPPIFHITKAIVFFTIILGVAEVCSRRLYPHLTPRIVPNVITSSVVVAGMIVIVADWAFSQLWMQRH